MINTRARANTLTIDELAAETGLTVRNIRAYQSRDLVPGPEIRGRVGYYGAEHVDRIRLIGRFQTEGFNLAAIAALVERGDAFLDQVTALREQLRDSVADGWVPVDEEAIRMSEESRPGSLAIFRSIGTIRVDSDGVMLTHPGLAEAGWELNRLGLSPDAIIDLLLATHRTIRKMGDVYVALWQARAEAALVGTAENGDVEAMRDAFEQTTPPAVQLMTTLFEVILRKDAAEAFERTVRDFTPSD